MALIDNIARAVRIAPAPRVSFSLWTALQVWRSRRALARLDAKGLDDIAVSPRAAQREAQKPFWDVPATWRD
ncbi:MAG: hypothetical protein AAFN94_08680 [Pseudomonadota bacterium]